MTRDNDHCKINGQPADLRRISPLEQQAKQQRIKADDDFARALNAKSNEMIKALGLLHKARSHLPEVPGQDVASLIDQIDLFLGHEVTTHV